MAYIWVINFVLLNRSVPPQIQSWFWVESLVITLCKHHLTKGKTKQIVHYSSNSAALISANKKDLAKFSQGAQICYNILNNAFPHCSTFFMECQQLTPQNADRICEPCNQQLCRWLGKGKQSLPWHIWTDLKKGWRNGPIISECHLHSSRLIW